MTTKKIYLDHAATTPLDPEVLKAMMPYLKNKFGNASSLHSFGQEASAGIETARAIIAKFLHAEIDEIIFTSGATESDNLAIFGISQAIKKSYPQIPKLHIITSKIEHPAVLEPFQKLERSGEFEVTYLPVNKQGLIKIETVTKAIKDNTVLISLMYANNEIGVIQPIAEIGNLIEQINIERQKNKEQSLGKIYFHTDAVQAATYCDCDVSKLKVDSLSLSGHKIYGPKGVGVLYLKKKTPFTPLLIGGHQENNKRSGTYNTPAIVGLGKAVELIQNKKQQQQIKTIKKLRDYFSTQIIKKITNIQINGDLEKRLPNNLNVSFINAEGESLLIMLDMAGIAVSTGSACSSGSLEPSHVLAALNIPPEICHGSIRFTLGKQTTKKEIDCTIKELIKTVDRLRQMAPK